jgi:hypothetical protein
MATARLRRGFSAGIGCWPAKFRWRPAVPRPAAPAYSRRAVIGADHGGERLCRTSPATCTSPRGAYSGEVCIVLPSGIWLILRPSL